MRAATITQHISSEERRARIVARHHLGRTASDVLAAVRAVVACHSSDPITPFLAAWARVPELARSDVERALYVDRVLWRLHAMRRTLFVVPSDEAALFHAAAGADVARVERKRLEAWIGAEIGPNKVARWIRGVEAAILVTLSDGAELRTQDLNERVPELAREVTLGSGKWAQRAAIGSRVLFLMAMEGRIARTRPAGTWRGSQYRWIDAVRFAGGTSTFGTIAGPVARAEVVRRYLATHGPATEIDVRWWTGWTAAAVKAALGASGAVSVSLDGDKSGFVLPDDGAFQRSTKMSVAFLPGLDSTTMGWKERGFYLGDLERPLFDRNGNAGPTVWVDGRIVGGWSQRPDGQVVYRLLDEVSSTAKRRVKAEADALTEWLGGTVAVPRFRTPLDRELASTSP